MTTESGYLMTVTVEQKEIKIESKRPSAAGPISVSNPSNSDHPRQVPIALRIIWIIPGK